jgi:uncharacterized membrane protein YozB (DUF420 family)
MELQHHDDLRLTQTWMRVWRWPRWMMLAGLGVFVIYTALRGISESYYNDGFPEALAVKLELLPIIFPLHMITGGLALLLVPLALSLRGTAWHKVAGRVAAADIVIAAITAIPVALDVPVTRVSAAGFVMQAITWMTLLGFGIWHIRQGRIAEHRACMLMVAAVTSGAMYFRIYLGLWKVFGTTKYFTIFYACDAWVAWSLPLLMVALWLSKNSLPAMRSLTKSIAPYA